MNLSVKSLNFLPRQKAPQASMHSLYQRPPSTQVPGQGAPCHVGSIGSCTIYIYVYFFIISFVYIIINTLCIYYMQIPMYISISIYICT